MPALVVHARIRRVRGGRFGAASLRDAAQALDPCRPRAGTEDPDDFCYNAWVGGAAACIRAFIPLSKKNMKEGHMSEILSELWTPEMQMALTAAIAFLVVLYVLSIIWVVRDAYLRGTVWYIWAVVALVPILGIVAYSMLRPPLLQLDRDEQELEVALKQRQLLQYGECASCGYPVEADYVICPKCHQRLKNQCGTCGHALDPSWTVCPYCATPVGERRSRSASN